MSKEPLGLPRGSVRAILTLMVVMSVLALSVLACVGFEPPAYVWAMFSAALTLVLRDYFGQREVTPPVGEGEADLAKDE